LIIYNINLFGLITFYSLKRIQNPDFAHEAGILYRSNLKKPIGLNKFNTKNWPLSADIRNTYFKEGMKLKFGYLLALFLAVTLSSASESSVYQFIGAGGPDKFNLSSDSTHGFEIFLGLPDLSIFYKPEEYSSDIMDYIYNDEITLNGGHVFEFQGDLELANDYDTYWIKDLGRSRIIVQNFGDIICEKRSTNPRACYIKSPGYIVNGERNLHRIVCAKIITMSDEDSCKYLGTGYLLRIQTITDSASTKIVPDPGNYTTVTWSGVEWQGKLTSEDTETSAAVPNAPAINDTTTSDMAANNDTTAENSLNGTEDDSVSDSIGPPSDMT